MKNRNTNPALNLSAPPKRNYLVEATASGLPDGVGMLSRVFNEARDNPAASAEIAALGNAFIQELQALPQQSLDDLFMLINQFGSPGKNTKPVCHVDENGKLVLDDWLIDGLPEQGRAPLQRLLERICLLAYQGICTPAGELRADIRNYIGENDLRDAAKVFTIKTLIEKFSNSAMLYLIVPFLESLNIENEKLQSIKYIVSTLVNNANLNTLPQLIQNQNNAAAVLKSETLKLDAMRKSLTTSIRSFRDEMVVTEQALMKPKLSSGKRAELVKRREASRQTWLAKIAEERQHLTIQMEMCEQLLYTAYTAVGMQPISPSEFEAHCRQIRNNIPEVANLDKTLQKARRLNASVKAKHLVTPQKIKHTILSLFGVDTVRKHSVNALKSAENQPVLDYYSHKQSVMHLFAFDPDLSAMRHTASADEIALHAGRFLQNGHKEKPEQLFEAMRIFSDMRQQNPQSLPADELEFIQKLAPLINMLRLMHGMKNYTTLPSYIKSEEHRQKLLEGARYAAEAGYQYQQRLPARENSIYLLSRVQQGVPGLSRPKVPASPENIKKSSGFPRSAKKSPFFKEKRKTSKLSAADKSDKLKVEPGNSSNSL